MAHPTLPVLSHPDFPQVFAAAMDTQLRAPSIQLSRCEYESPESRPGLCDGGEQCTQTATIYDCASERELCFRHYLRGSRG
jgi:hypothetical protein